MARGAGGRGDAKHLFIEAPTEPLFGIHTAQPKNTSTEDPFLTATRNLQLSVPDVASFLIPSSSDSLLS